MSIDNRSNSQLYAIIQNEQMYASIRKMANEEFTSRNLTTQMIQEIVNHFDSEYKTADQEELDLVNKIFLLLSLRFSRFRGLSRVGISLVNRRKNGKTFCFLYVQGGSVAFAAKDYF